MPREVTSGVSLGETIDIPNTDKPNNIKRTPKIVVNSFTHY